MGKVLMNFPLSFRSGPMYVSQPLRFFPLKSISHSLLYPDFVKANTHVSNTSKSFVGFITENYGFAGIAIASVWII